MTDRQYSCGSLIFGGTVCSILPGNCLSSAMIRSETYTYSDAGTVYEAFLSWDDQFHGERPVVLVFPTFRGQTEFENGKARLLAEMGYLALAVDLYGQGRRGVTPDVAAALMEEQQRDRGLLRSRLLMVLDKISSHSLADDKQIGAIGFCFGGKCVLDLARAGVPIKGVVSFHGIYDAPAGLSEPDIKASVLVLHGWLDPLSPPESLLELSKELERRSRDWQILTFGSTGHAFTNPNASNPEGGLFFQSRSNDRAWRKMREFFEELFV